MNITCIILWLWKTQTQTYQKQTYRKEDIMKSSSARCWNAGEKGITANGEIVTVKEIIGERYLKIHENIEKKVYIPAHGEIEKLNWKGIQWIRIK